MPEIKVFSSHYLSACVLIIAVIGLIFTAAPIVGAATPITLDSVSTKDNSGIIGAVSTLSWSHTVAPGASIIIVAVSEDSIIPPPTVVSVTFGSSSLTLIGREDASPGIQASHVELWSLLNPPTGTRTVTFTLSTTETAVVGAAISFFNVIGTTLFTGSNDGGAFTTPSITVPAVTGELVVGVLATCGVNCGSSQGAPTPGAGSTAAYISNDFMQGELFAAASYAPAASPVTLSWVYTSTNWAMGGVALDPPASAIPEYPFGLPILAIFMVLAYAVIKRRTSNPKNI